MFVILYVLILTLTFAGVLLKMTRITKNRRLSGGGKPKIKIGASTTPALVPLKAVVRQARGNMKVVVRIRPVNRNENSNRLVVRPVSESQLVFDPHEEEEGFFFHGVKQNGFRYVILFGFFFCLCCSIELKIFNIELEWLHSRS